MPIFFRTIRVEISPPIHKKYYWAAVFSPPPGHFSQKILPPSAAREFTLIVDNVKGCVRGHIRWWCRVGCSVLVGLYM